MVTASMKVPARRRGNLMGDCSKTDVYGASMKVPARRRGNAANVDGARACLVPQ